MNNLLHKKRRGTSGVSGQLYETKLISLILFRATHDDDIKEFYIGTNVDELGDFDDICFRFKTKKLDKPVAVFIQAKHRDDKNKILELNKIDLVKYFDSYLKIRSKFELDSSDPFFKGTYDDVECKFIFYTTTNTLVNKKCEENDLIAKINDVISTGANGFQLSYTGENLIPLNKIVLRDEIKKLAAVVANLVKDKGNYHKNIMNNKLIQTYHVILAHKVFDISDINQEHHCIGRIKSEFYETNDPHLLLFKEFLFSEVLKQNKRNLEETSHLLSLLCSKVSVDTIKPLIGSVIKYNNNKLEFVDNKMNNKKDLREQLERVNILPSEVAVAKEIGAVEILQNVEFKLPTVFGNSDLTIRGDVLKIERRLNHLAMQIIKLLSEHNNMNGTYKLVNIDDTFPDKGFGKTNGGISSAVGNLLVLDEKNNLLKFENYDKLKGLAKRLFEKINSNVEELEKYRFNITVTNCPKLIFECNNRDRSIAADFTKRLLFYTNQAREWDVEDIVKKEITQTLNTKSHCTFQITADAIFLRFHDIIQKWWMKQNNAEYLTKTSQLTAFQKATEVIVRNPLLTCISHVFRNDWCIKNSIKFNSRQITTLKVDNLNSNVNAVVSSVISLTVVRVTQCYELDEYILLDLKYILSLPETDCRQLNAELKSVKNKILILTCNSFSCASILHNNVVQDILKTLNGNRLIVITNNESVEHLRKYFLNTIITIDNKISLTDLTNESQEILLRNTRVLFQDVEVSLNLILDNQSKVLITEDHLKQIINGESITIGTSLTNPSYENTKSFYVSRQVSDKHSKFDMKIDSLEQDSNNESELINLESFYDIDKHTVLITGEPGMGKSSLLTDLSLKTKTRDPNVWIIRVNLLDYSRFFYQWKENKVDIDTIEAMRFLCMALVDQKENSIISTPNIILNENNGEIFMSDCSRVSEVMGFEIKLFLHFCNHRQVIFLFDGFDEICPNYEMKGIEFLKILTSYHPSDHRIWITSRNYNQILNNLEQEFGKSYRLQLLSYRRQEIFIQRFLDSKLDLSEMNCQQIDKINEFIAFMLQSLTTFKTLAQTLPLYHVYYNILNYFLYQSKHVSYLKDIEKYKNEMPTYTRYDPIYRGEFIQGKGTYAPHIEIAIPLHIYLVADYFQNEIKNTQTATKWNLNLNTYAIFERFIETKFKKIRFEDKNKMDMHRPDVQSIYEKEHKEFLTKHKKLALYMVYLDNAYVLVSITVMKEIKDTIKSIELGEEKSGLIEGVVHGQPRFVHKIFAEYLAVEYICDWLKTEQSFKGLVLAWNFIGQSDSGTLGIFNDKLMIDEELSVAVSRERHRKILLVVLFKYATFDYFIFSYSCLNMPYLMSLFLSTFEFVNQTNIDDFITFIFKTNLIESATRRKLFDCVNAILDTARNIDKSKMKGLFNHMNYDIKYDGTNDEIIEDVLAFLTFNYSDPNTKYKHIPTYIKKNKESTPILHKCCAL